ncbi:MAG: hypothetical protein AB7O45_00520 [Alphaproteobacteria bacterium]
MARSASQRIDTIWNKTLEPDLKRYHIRVAREALAAEQARGFDPKPRRIVDRRFDAPLEAVKTGGVIEFVARADIADIARWIWARLVEKSPVGSPPADKHPGLYKRSHVAMLNGVAMNGIEAVLRAYKPGDTIQLVNTQPYAKKIEGRGRSARGAAIRPLSKQAPTGVYRSVYASAHRRYGKTAWIDFTYVRLNTGITAWGYVGGGKNRKRARRPVVYPTIKLKQGASALTGSPT